MNFFHCFAIDVDLAGGSRREKLSEMEYKFQINNENIDLEKTIKINKRFFFKKKKVEIERKIRQFNIDKVKTDSKMS